MEGSEKEVYYDKYCPTCKYEDVLDKDGFLNGKCEECLATPMNIDSHKPVNYKEELK